MVFMSISALIFQSDISREWQWSHVWFVKMNYTVELETHLNTAEICLYKIDNKLRESGTLDYNSLQKFKNIIECLPGCESTQDYERELLHQIDNVLCKKSWICSRSTQVKIYMIIELFSMIKEKYEDTLEHESSKAEKVFLTTCAFLFTMLMFAP